MEIDPAQLKARAKDYWNALDESQRTTRKVLAILFVAAVIGVPVWFWGKPIWRKWQHGQAVEQVRIFAEQRDYRNAALALRRAIELDPANPATWQQAVRLLGEIGSPEVLTAREQLARMKPEDPALKLALARDALRFDRLELAQETLDQLVASGQQDAAFYRLMASLAQALGREQDMEQNLARLVEASPNDPKARFAYAAARVWSVDFETQQQARAELETLIRDPQVRVPAAIELLKVAIKASDERRWNETVTFLQRTFIPGWGADWPAGGETGWARLVEHLALAAAADGADSVAAFGRWRASFGQRRETLVWIEGLSESLLEARAVKETAAEISAELGDLERVENYLRDGAWGVWPREVLTLAVASRLQQLRHSESHARATWEDALRAAGNSLPALRALTRLANAWGDTVGRERALTTVVAKFPKSYWAYEALAAGYANRRDLAGLWSVCDAWQKYWPNDPELMVRWAVLAAILDKLNPEIVRRAEELHERQPTAVGAQTALAAVRWREGKPQETLRLLAPAHAEVASDANGRDFWLSLAYVDVGQPDEAAEHLRRAIRGRLSVEEGRLLHAAAAKAKVRLDNPD